MADERIRAAVGSVVFFLLAPGIWLAGFVLAVTTFVVAYEEPTLRATFGASYDDYVVAVRRWRPRLRPWHGQRLSPET